LRGNCSLRLFVSSFLSDRFPYIDALEIWVSCQEVARHLQNLMYSTYC
jgi:hypothetical protein